MPELHQTPAALSAATIDGAARLAADDYDYALGCECADPALQIERWGIDEPDAGQSA